MTVFFISIRMLMHRWAILYVSLDSMVSSPISIHIRRHTQQCENDCDVLFLPCVYVEIYILDLKESIMFYGKWKMENVAGRCYHIIGYIDLWGQLNFERNWSFLEDIQGEFSIYILYLDLTVKKTNVCAICNR